MFKGYCGTLFTNNSLTPTFSDIWDNAEDFKDEYLSCPLGGSISADNVIKLFYLLYAKHANDHIASTDLNQFKFGVWSTIFKYGSAWEERLDLQAKIKALTDEEIRQGNTQINNHATNPSVEPNVDAFEALPYIDNQNAALVRRNKLEAYASKYNQIVTDVTEEFLAHFKHLFRIFMVGMPLLYTDEEENDDGNNI